MKAIIPVAGTGKRLRPLTYTQPKPLIPVAGKPIISFIIDELIAVGVSEFVFIIGYLGDKIKDHLEAKYPQIQKTFVEQTERKGSAHALWLAREAYADADEIIIFFGDTIIDTDFAALARSPHNSIGVKRVEDPRHFGVVEFDEEGEIARLTEKPLIPTSNQAMVGCYKIREVEQFIAACAYNLENGLESADATYSITDALARMHEWGSVLKTFTVDNWYDCGQKEVLLATNAAFLQRPGFATDDPPPHDNSIIIHPVHIGGRCVISNSIVGPNVTIGANTHIENAIIDDSILGEFSTIQDIILRHSIIGSDASIRGSHRSLHIGDNTEIDFGI